MLLLATMKKRGNKSMSNDESDKNERMPAFVANPISLPAGVGEAINIWSDTANQQPAKMWRT